MSGKEAARAVDLTGLSLIFPHQATWREKSVRARELKAAPVIRSGQGAPQLPVQELRRRGYRRLLMASTDPAEDEHD
jgi:hypothetical protein